MIDLGALFSGLAKGYGSSQELRLAEHLRRVADEQAFSRQQQLADTAFAREKELLALRNAMEMGNERQSLEGELLKALGGAETLGIPGLGGVPENTASLPTADLMSLIGQIEAAIGLVGQAREERAGAPKEAAGIAATQALEEQRLASASKSNRWVPRKDRPPKEPAGPKPAKYTVQQWTDAIDDRMMRMLGARDRKEFDEMMAGANPESIAVIRKAAVARLIQELGPDVVPEGVATGDVDAPLGTAARESARPSLEDLAAMSLRIPGQ